jgi:catechol 2,3-dioxygenase-like lactoylglutathione lyase family enzyme
MTALELDHLGIAVNDLDAAAAQFRRLGFQFTARGYHTLPPPQPGGERPLVGTGNHCAMLRRGYLELIGITDPAYAGRLRQDLARYQGLHIIAFGTPDANQTAEELRVAGLDVKPPRMLERPITHDGAAALARFEIVDFPETAVPEMYGFAIHHATPHLLWEPPLLKHPNGAERLEGVTIAVDQPADFGARLSRLLGVAPSEQPVMTFDLAAGQVRVVDLEWIASTIGETPEMPRVAGLTVAVADLGRAAELLKVSAVDFEPRAGALLVPPIEACGAFLEFVPIEAQPR